MMATAFVSASLEVRGNIVTTRFEDFTLEPVKIGVKTLYDIAMKWRAELATYPAPYEGDPPFEWSSENQRKYVMWAIRHGVIQVPYHRTGQYGWNWRLVRDRSISASSGVIYRLYSTTQYAQFVSGGSDFSFTEYFGVFCRQDRP